MSSLKDAIVTELEAASAVTDLVGTAIYDQRVPQSAGETYIRIYRISNPHDHHLSGSAGLAHSRVQVNCVAPRANTAHSIYDAVRETLDAFRGTMGTGDYTVTVRSCVLDNDRDDLGAPVAGRQEGPCTVMMDFLISYVETEVENIA